MSGAPTRPEPTAETLDVAALWLMRSSKSLCAEEQAELEAWLGRDPSNGAAFEQVSLAWNAVGAVGSVPEVIGLRRRALRNASRAARRRWIMERSGPQWIAAVAACLVLAVGVGVYLGGGRQAQVQTFQTAAGEHRVVTLADRSRISLDAATEVRVRYSRRNRDLQLLRGQAEFEVAKDVARPFAVTAGGRTVIATGTLFNIDLLSSRMIVTLLNGRVLVAKGRPTGWVGQGPGAEVGLGAVELKPAEQLVVNGAEQTIVRAPLNLDDALAWKAGKLIFVDEPLPQALDRVNRYSSKQISLRYPPAETERISGVFNTGDSAAFVAGVTAQLGIRTGLSPDGGILLYGPS